MTIPTEQLPSPVTRAEASKYLRDVHGMRYSVRSLDNAAWRGDGPLFRLQSGRLAIYEIGDLDTWARSRLSPKMRSTSERTADRISAEAVDVETS